MSREVTMCKCPTCDQLVEADKIGRGVYQCFHCCTYSLVWDSDFDFDDYGYEGEGIVHVCHCTNCGADVEYRVGFDKEDE